MWRFSRREKEKGHFPTTRHMRQCPWLPQWVIIFQDTAVLRLGGQRWQKCSPLKHWKQVIWSDQPEREEVKLEKRPHHPSASYHPARQEGQHKRPCTPWSFSSHKAAGASCPLGSRAHTEETTITSENVPDFPPTLPKTLNTTLRCWPWKLSVNSGCSEKFT